MTFHRTLYSFYCRTLSFICADCKNTISANIYRLRNRIVDSEGFPALALRPDEKLRMKIKFREKADVVQIEVSS
jgi:hypothetical protein